MTTVAQGLKEAKDRLYARIQQHLLEYENETGLIIDEIGIIRPFALIGTPKTDMQDIRVRTNANLIK